METGNEGGWNVIWRQRKVTAGRRKRDEGRMKKKDNPTSTETARKKNKQKNKAKKRRKKRPEPPTEAGEEAWKK